MRMHERSYIDQQSRVDLVNFIRKRENIHMNMIVIRMLQFLNLRFSEEGAPVIQSWPKTK